MLSPSGNKSIETQSLQRNLGGSRILQLAPHRGGPVSVPAPSLRGLACSMVLAYVSSSLFLHINSDHWT